MLLVAITVVVLADLVLAVLMTLIMLTTILTLVMVRLTVSTVLWMHYILQVLTTWLLNAMQ